VQDVTRFAASVTCALQHARSSFSRDFSPQTRTSGEALPGKSLKALFHFVLRAQSFDKHKNEQKRKKSR